MKNSGIFNDWIYHRLPFLAFTAFLFFAFPSLAQDKTVVDGKEFTQYHRKYFNPHRGIFYSIYVSPILTVDPLGFGGKSTYAFSAGVQFRLWESKTPDNLLTGLKIKGIYTAIGYEHYPKQFDKTLFSFWVRIKTFIPLTAKFDYIYATGYGLRGISYRNSIGVEIKKVSIFVCGEGYFYHLLGGPHPITESPYTNAGEIMMIIPVFTRKEK